MADLLTACDFTKDQTEPLIDWYRENSPGHTRLADIGVGPEMIVSCPLMAGLFERLSESQARPVRAWQAEYDDG